MNKLFFVFIVVFTLQGISAQNSLRPKVDQEVEKVKQKVIDWRRDFHQYPELANQEFRSSKIIAKHLRSLGMEVKEGVAKTGVIAILKGGKPGPVVALRADMDALPVEERNNLSFKSVNSATYNNQKTGVMHACGHDSHMAMLMGAAEVLAGMRNELKGTVKFFFQPAEEGVYGESEPFGANAMVLEGCMENPKVDAVFGIHIASYIESGHIHYKAGPDMAAVNDLFIKVKGKQSHGAAPWTSIDPIATGAQIVMGLQTIVSRNLPIDAHPAVVSIGSFQGGIRENIIPESVEMRGTIRTFDKEVQKMVHKRIREISTNIAESAGASSEIKIGEGYPVTYNNPELTQRMIPVLAAAAGGNDKIKEKKISMGAEDFSYYAEKAPGLFIHLGARDPKIKESEAAPHHTPDFYLDESNFHVGVKAFCYLVLDYFNK